MLIGYEIIIGVYNCIVNKTRTMCMIHSEIEDLYKDFGMIADWINDDKFNFIDIEICSLSTKEGNYRQEIFKRENLTVNEAIEILLNYSKGAINND